MVKELISKEGSGWAYSILFGSAFIESLFPPFPSDALILFGAFLVGQGLLKIWLFYLSVVAGSLGGVMTVYYIGFTGGRALFHSGKFSFLNLKGLEKIERGFHRHGFWLLLLNRFIAGVRAFIFLLSGIAHLDWRMVAFLGFLSIAVWNGILLCLGIYLGNEAESLLNRFFMVSTGIFLLSLFGWFLKHKFRV